MSNVFISYARADSSIAHALSEMLQAEGQTVFFDFAIASGEDFSRNIEKALADASAVVVLLSENSNRSRFVGAEIRSALQAGKVVIPVLLDDEATNNWVWPLVSDRNAIRLESPNEISKVVKQVNRAISLEETLPEDSLMMKPPPFARSTAPAPASARRSVASRWVTLLIAIFSALAGALVMWLRR